MERETDNPGQSISSFLLFIGSQLSGTEELWRNDRIITRERRSDQEVSLIVPCWISPGPRPGGESAVSH